MLHALQAYAIQRRVQFAPDVRNREPLGSELEDDSTYAEQYQSTKKADNVLNGIVQQLDDALPEFRVVYQVV